ncbi:MAG: endo-1,4-beta-xylanase, partial [Planctomycetaceae bacterium]
MGVMRFTVHPAGLLSTESDLLETYISGFDGRVFPARVELTPDQVEIRRMNSDSGKLHIAYPVEDFGCPVISTATLRESDTPYILSLELARGRIVQLRNQLAVWEGLGMMIPGEFRELHQASHHLFAQATAAKPDVVQVCRYADAAIAKSLAAADILTTAYVHQRLTVRLKRSSQLPVSFGCGINCGEVIESHGEVFQQAFNSAAIPIRWKQIEKQEGEYVWDLPDQLVEWGTENRLLLRGGPLLNLSPHGLPEWLKQWGHDFFNLQSFLSDFVETAINRYLGRVRIWEISSRVNTGGAFNLNEEERLTLVARTLEVARQVDEEAQLII